MGGRRWIGASGPMVLTVLFAGCSSEDVDPAGEPARQDAAVFPDSRAAPAPDRGDSGLPIDTGLPVRPESGPPDGGVDSGAMDPDASSPPLLELDFEPLCYDLSVAVTVTVSSCSALQAALDGAAPGDVIVIGDGTYGCALSATQSGNDGQPIVVRAASPFGARLQGTSLVVSGNHTVITGLVFDDSGIDVRGDRNRVTGNRFQNDAGPLRAAVTVTRGSEDRIDHNEIVDYGVGQRGIRVLPSTDNTAAKRNVIDRNYLHRSLGEHTNGADGIQLGSNGSHSGEELYTIVEWNLIEQWEIDGEMISNKSSRNVIRFNTLADSAASGPIRHGTHVSVISNHFVDVKALVIYGDDHVVVGNVVENADLVVRDGDGTESDILAGDQGLHPAARRTLVAGNTVTGGEICVGCRVPSGNAASGVPASDTDLQGNVGLVTLRAEQRTTQSPTYGGPVLPAIRPSPADVGPGSPDVCEALP